MNKLKKGEIQKELNLALGRIKQMERKMIRLELINRNYERHLKQMRKKIDYLIKHPYANDTGIGRVGEHKKIKTPIKNGKSNQKEEL